MNNNIRSLIHRYAHSNFSETCGNVSCSYGDLYSYSLLIGKRFESGVIAINLVGSSSTTAKHQNISSTTARHQNMLHDAVSHFKFKYLCYFDGNARFLSLDKFIAECFIPHYVREFKDIIERATRRYSRKLVNEAERLSEKLGRCNNYEAIREVYSLLGCASYSDFLAVHFNADIIKEYKINAKRAKEREEQLAIESLNAWRKCYTNDLHRHDGLTYLRLFADKIVESSKGITMDIHTAMVFYHAFSHKLLKVGDTVLDTYRIDAILEDRIKIGCHTILNSEIEQVYQQIQGVRYGNDRH